MNWQGQVILSVPALAFWLLGFDRHKKCLPSSEEAVRLPRLAGLLFGSLREDGILSAGGMAAQLGVYLFYPALALSGAGIVSGESLTSWAFWSGIGLGLAAAVWALAKGLARKK